MKWRMTPGILPMVIRADAGAILLTPRPPSPEKVRTQLLTA
jgi:hypothetical protein